MQRYFSRKAAKIVFTAMVLALFSAITAYATVRGPHRALTPVMFGLSEIAPDVFSDSPYRATEMLGHINRAKQINQDFFGSFTASPRIIICHTKTCEATFGWGPRGVAYGFGLVKLNPKGANLMIITHELFHAELHQRQGYFDLFTQTVPSWFNEGMATFVSGDTRFQQSFTKAELDLIRATTTRKQWSQLNRDRGWPFAYGGALAIVKQLHKQHGMDGLRSIIRRVTKDDIPFDKALAELE